MQASESKSISVMLVDDHRTILWGLQQLIDGQHPRMHVVATASTIEEPLQKARNTKPDIILLDINLGEDSSLEILPDLIREGNSQVLILTGVTEQPLLDWAAMMGARGVVSKEEDPETLLNAIVKVSAGEIWLDRETTARVFKGLREKREKENIEVRKLNLLTHRERKVVEAVVKDFGSSNKVLAKQLFMSESTLRNHLSTIYSKLEVDNRISLYVYATCHGFGAGDAGGENERH